MREGTYDESRLSLTDSMLGGGAQMFYRSKMFLVSITHKFYQWSMLSRQRRQLLRLNDEILKDVGISRYDAQHEARRWFWDVSGDTGVER